MLPTTPNPFRPAEGVLLSTPIGLNDLGAEFNICAPFAACRLCGAIYQSRYDRFAKDLLDRGLITEHFNPLTNSSAFTGDQAYMNVVDVSADRRARWNEAHRRRYHTDEEIEIFLKTGYAFTPEAAHKLAPFGITPLGNLSQEIADALFEAPRAPLDDCES